jgi:transposase
MDRGIARHEKPFFHFYRIVRSGSLSRDTNRTQIGGIAMISAIINEGKARFMVDREAMTQAKLIPFMARLVRDIGRKVYLILDSLKVHHGKKVAEWLEAHKDEIPVFYLPSYSPETNPDEYIDNDLKTRLDSGIPPGTDQELKRKSRSFVRMLVKRPHCVRSYFRHPMVVYAAG